MKKNLIAFLEANLMIKDFEELKKRLGNCHMWSRLINGTSPWTFNKVKILMSFLVTKGIFPDMPIEEWAMSYDIADELTVGNFKELNLLFIELTSVEA